MKDRSHPHKDYLLGMLDSSAEGLFTLNLEGIFLDVNLRICEITGYSKEQLIGKSVDEIVKEEDVFKNGFQEIKKNGQIRNLILNIKTKSQEPFIASIFASLFFSQEGEPLGIFGSARNITPQVALQKMLKEKNDELQQALLTKDRFLMMMSHEFRTPLTSILGFADLLLMNQENALSEKQRKHLELIQKSGNHLLQLVNDLLATAKIESGNLILNVETVNCETVLTEIYEELKPLADKKGLSMSLSLPQEPVFIQTDFRALKQILINLLNNAIKFTDVGTIQLSLEQTGSEIKIHVIDTGIGIKPEERKKLFTAFGQIETTKKHEGTGLGLYISSQLANLLNGSIQFRSHLKKGTQFTLILPLELTLRT